MSDTPISLTSLLTPSKTVTIDFAGYKGFKVDLCYLGREELMKLRKKCVTNKFNKRTRQPEEVMDEDLFIEAYCEAVIKNWEGLKLQYLEELLLVDISGQDPDAFLPYSKDNAEQLMKNSSIFDTWVTETVGDLENFTQNK